MPAKYCTLVFVTIFITVQIGTAQRFYVCERQVMAMQSAATAWGLSGLPYVRDYADRPSPGYDGMTVGEAFFQPMLQVIYYLQSNAFTVYVCSGSDRLVIRALIEGGLILAGRYVIGTEELISAKNQGNKSGSEYVLGSDEELVLSGKIKEKNLKMNKVSMLAEQVGQCPVLSFGNSAGDISMTNYVMSNEQYKTAAFFDCCAVALEAARLLKNS